jgi:Ca-activated chloride channel family protein
MKTSFLTLFLFIGVLALAQDYNTLVKAGNKLYEEGKYDEAELAYREALVENESGAVAQYNLGNALYRQGRAEEAKEAFSKAIDLTDSDQLKAKAHHNMGNVSLDSKKYEEAVKQYKESLKLNPTDDETRVNLTKALRSIRKQDQQQKQQQQKQDQKPEKIEPSEFAKALKARCEALAKEYKFKEAYGLMMQGLEKDKTVAAYGDFIKKLKDVVEML